MEISLASFARSTWYLVSSIGIIVVITKSFSFIVRDTLGFVAGVCQCTGLTDGLDACAWGRAGSVLLMGSLLLGLGKLVLAMVVLNLMECGGDGVEYAALMSVAAAVNTGGTR